MDVQTRADDTVPGSAPVTRWRPSGARRRQLLLFAKAPVPGGAKTRLVTPRGLTADQAAALAAAMAADLSSRLACGPWRLVVHWADAEGAEPPVELLPAGVEWRPQGGGSLGERLERGLRFAVQNGGYAAAVGSDHPELETERVEEAFEALHAGRGDVVLGPAVDGGYYLIGVGSGAVRTRLFEGIAWSTASVLAQTLERCDELGLRVELLPVLTDVDTVDDLRAFRAALDERPALRRLCPRTAELLSSWPSPAAGAGEGR